MGITKTRDGRYLVGQGVTDGNEYKGSLAWRDIVIQLSADGATAESIEKLEFLRDYGLYHSGEGNSVMPPSVSVWISNNGTTTAVEADDITVDGSNYTICGIKWNGSAWDFSQAGQGGGGGSSLPPYTSADKGKVLTVGEAEPETVVVIPEQTGTVIDLTSVFGQLAHGIEIENPNMSFFTNAVAGDAISLFANSIGIIITAVEYPGMGLLFVNNATPALTVAYFEGLGKVFATANLDIGDSYTISATASVPSVEPKWEKSVSPIKILGRASGSDTGVWDSRQECVVDVPSSYGVDFNYALMNVDVTVNEKSYHVDYLSPGGGSVSFDDLPAGIGGVEVYTEQTQNVSLSVSCFAGEPAAESINVTAEFTVYTLSDMLGPLLN